MKRIPAPSCAVLSLLAALAATSVSAQVPERMDAEAIPNYTLVRPGLATAGAPSPEALAQLGRLGFRTVINLRVEMEPGVKEEAEIVRKQGLTYLHVPITPASFSLEDVNAVSKALDDPNAAPILFHCASANRVGAVWTVLQVRKGKSYEAALLEGKQIGLSSPAMLEAVQRVLTSGK
jgi:uncharacterized protein (TIGR01244 family)